MKKRLFAVVLLAIMILPALCLTVFAAGVFPYGEFEKEGYHYQLRYSSDYDTERGEVIYPQGLMMKEHFEYKGYRDGDSRLHPLYEQSAVATIKVPDSFTDDLGTTVFYSPDWFTTYGGDTFRENFSYEGAGQVMTRHNAVSYSVAHESEITVLTPENRSQTVEEAIEKKVEYWKKYFQGDYHFGSDTNQATEPVSVQKVGNATVLIGREEKRFYSDDDNSLNAVKVYGFTSTMSYNYVYRIYYVVPELKGVFFELRYAERGSYSEKIEDKNQGEYRKYINDYEKIVNAHKDKKFAEQLIDLGSLLSVMWESPVISEEYNGVEPEETKQNAGVTQNAEENPGEDSGVSVPAAIVVGVAATGAAIAGAAAASGGSAEDRKKKSYKMYVQKDFGDAIRRGGDKPVKIRARMAEVDASGVERDRNDLTGNIGVSADGMTVHDAALVGRYCEATVSVPENNQSDTANIIFTYTGEGGSFTNTVVFRLVDGPQLKFVDERDGTLYGSGCGIDAIPGDGFTYTERFAIVDAPTAPKLSDITAVNTGEFDVEFALTDQPALYKMTVKNNTAPDPDHDIFAKPKDKDFEIHVVVEGEKEPVKGYVTVKLYPEGITVSSTMEGKKNDVKYVRVQAYEKEYVGDLDKKWQVSEIKFTLAVLGEDKAIIDPEEAKYKFEKIKGGDGLGGTRADKEQSIAEKFEYKESSGDWNGKFTYDFEPNSTLCEPDNGAFFIVLLPCSAEYNGETFKADIPLRLRGKDFDPMAGWEEEYAKLKERIEKFSLPENKDDLLKRLANLAEDPRCSTEELRLTSKWVVRQYMTYWTIQSMKSQDEAKVYDVIIDYLEWAKFFGDCAFSILVNMYAGPVADAIISPTKDFLAEAIGETMACWMRGQSVNPDSFNFSKNVFVIFDNFVSGNISFASWKQAAYTLGAYFAFASIKNFYMTLREQNKFDLYGAIVHGFADTTATGLKAAAGHLFDAALKKCPGFRAKLSAWCGSFVSKHLGSSASLLDLRAVDGLTRATILRKYLDGFFGMGIDKLVELDTEIHDKFISSQNGFEFNSDGHLIVTFYFEVNGKNYECAVDVNKALSDALSTAGQVIADGGFFAYLFNELYGTVPFSASVIEAPKDPPLLTFKN